MLRALVDVLREHVPLELRGVDVDVRQVHRDSRRIEAGDLFAALPGSSVDGSAFARAACERGAVAVLAARETDAAVPHLIATDAREAMAWAAHALCGHPTQQLAAYLTTAFVVGGVGAWHLLKDKTNLHARKMFSMAMWMATLVTPLQIFAGDLHGLNTLEHQPQKIMAMEGHYQSHPDGAPLILFGIPDSEARTVRYAVEIPQASSLILKHDPAAPLAGLDTIPDDQEPPVGMVFWSFRIMVGIGFAMLGIGAWSLYARWRKQLYDWTLLHRCAIAMAPSGFVAVLAGWITTEVGRQPYVIYGLLRTSDAASPLDAPAVAVSLLAFILVYFTVFGIGVGYILRLMAKTPHVGELGAKRGDTGPIRTAGITPGPTQNPGHEETLPTGKEDA